MTRSFLCPKCQRTASFAGIKGSLIVRTTLESVAVFTCETGHTFCMLLADVTSDLGLQSAGPVRFSDIRKTPLKAGNEFRRESAIQNGVPETPLPEPPGWSQLQARAKEETEPKRLGLILDQMNSLLLAWEKTQAPAPGCYEPADEQVI